MLLKAKALKSYALSATDGQLGKLSHLYFDEESWVVRYVVVNSGKRGDPTDNWFSGRQILLPPSRITTVSPTALLIGTSLTRLEVGHKRLLGPQP